MPLHDERCFVQFIHPGGEHRPLENAVMEWNRGAHRRKFVEVAGRCRRGQDEFDGPIRFWAEWEPQSEIRPVFQPLEHGPRFVHRPFYVIPDSYDGLKNTDPFVFGDFDYAGCQQNTCRGATQLRFLKNGSVILFGSCINDQFVLDTVFVVDDWKDYDAQNFRQLEALAPQACWDVTLLPLFPKNAVPGCGQDSTPHSCRLYRGASFENPVDGMFSFFPCTPADHCPRGFSRPVITIPDAITNELRQGKRLNRGLTQRTVQAFWDKTRQQVESAGLWLGIHADTPKRRGN